MRVLAYLWRPDFCIDRCSHDSDITFFPSLSLSLLIFFLESNSAVDQPWSISFVAFPECSEAGGIPQKRLEKFGRHRGTTGGTDHDRDLNGAPARWALPWKLNILVVGYYFSQGGSSDL